MNDHNLDDLILDTRHGKKSMLKNLLTLVALLIVILFAGIVLSRMILNDSTKLAQDVEVNGTENVDPELTLVDDDTDRAFPDKLSKTSEPETTQTIDTPDIVKPKPVFETPKQHETKPVAIQTHIQPKSQPHATPTRTAEVHKTRPKTLHPTPSPTDTASQRAFYIQVGAFAKMPPEKTGLIRKIRQNGYAYTVRTSARGTKKVLIGPYRSRDAADRAIVRIKRLINAQAFVVKPQP